ncbi:site-2 protease family protein [Candidatus Babeliales bacterium]|nr:site-2 protease family protein [Candidatus Babeliales bacterium]
MTDTSFLEILLQLTIIIVSSVIALVIHRRAHKKTAHLLGGTIKRNHIFICVPSKYDLLIPAKQRAFNQNDFQNFKRPALHTALTLLAGPASNILIALTSVFVIFVMPVHLFYKPVATCLVGIFATSALANAIIVFFSLLPFPTGSDGNHLLAIFRRQCPRFYQASKHLVLALLFTFLLLSCLPIHPPLSQIIMILVLLTVVPLYSNVVLFRKPNFYVTFILLGKIMMNPSAGFFAQLAIMLPAFLISLSVHECSHALAATLLGDNTARRQGRLTLNPLAHIDPLGLLFLLLFKIGWAKPVIFDQRNFKYPRFYAVLTAFAGPASNFIFALVCFYALAYFPARLFSVAVGLTLVHIVQATAYVNIMLGVFNLLPIPPLDGGHLVTALLMKRYPHVVAWLYQYSIFFLLFIFLLPQTRTMLIQLIIIAEQIIRSLVF